MIYYYDLYGNPTPLVNPDRSTMLAPPTCSGGQQPNWTGSSWVCATVIVPSPPSLPWPYGTRLTSNAFFNRMGAANVIWLYTQAQTNPTLQYYKDKAWGGVIDLADPIVATDLNYLLTLTGSPFTSANISLILNSPVTQTEAPT